MPNPPPLPLDDAGLLPEAAFPFPARVEAYTVFAQQRDARIDAAAWDRHARQFFEAEVKLTRPKAYGPAAPMTDGAHVVLTPRGRAGGMRSVFLRPRTEADVAFAEEAERAAGGGGMSLLAKRCEMVALVAVTPEQDDEDDVALWIAAIIASVVLGPILSPARPEIFGIRTARVKLAALANRPLA
jgi:hypothetical protein